MPNPNCEQRSHYLYRLREPTTGSFYVGVRSCNGLPELDNNYLGSGRWPRSKVFDKVALNKEILACFPTRELAEEAEQLLIDMVALDSCCRNSIKTASADIKAPRRTKWGYR